jgi:hypothetical protein
MPRGRPAKPPEERRGSPLQIRLTAEERAALDDLARQAGHKQTAAWAREVLLALVKRHRPGRASRLPGPA